MTFFFEPTESSRRNNFWIEFQAKKARPASKSLSAQHRKAISDGLIDYYEENPRPKKQKDWIDSLDRLSRPINRLSRAGKTILSTLNLADGMYQGYKYRNSRRYKYDNAIGAINAGAGALGGVAGALSKVGRTPQSYIGTANQVTDLVGRGQANELKKRALDLKEKSIKTERDIHAVRAKLERARLKVKKEENETKRVTSGSYKDLVGSVARTSPGKTRAALQRAATAAKKGDIRKGDDFWFLDEDI